eukprot:554696-Pyramimonas_sp.AAC.1
MLRLDSVSQRPCSLIAWNGTPRAAESLANPARAERGAKWMSRRKLSSPFLLAPTVDERAREEEESLW